MYESQEQVESDFIAVLQGGQITERENQQNSSRRVEDASAVVFSLIGAGIIVFLAVILNIAGVIK